MSSLDKADVALVDKVGEGKTLVLILLGNRNYKSEIGSNELVFSALSLRAALLDFLGKLNLFVN